MADLTKQVLQLLVGSVVSHAALITEPGGEKITLDLERGNESATVELAAFGDRKFEASIISHEIWSGR